MESPRPPLDNDSVVLNITMPMMTTTKEVVAALGGPRRTAEWAGVSVPQIYNWLADGAIPRTHHLATYLALTQRGYRVDTAVLFGVDEDGNYIPVKVQVSA